MRAQGFRAVSLAGAVLALAGLMSGQARAQFPGQGDDTTTSLGKFSIYVNTPFVAAINAAAPALTGLGYTWTPATQTLTSPILYDPSTVIGRSAPLLAGSAADNAGVAVGTAGTMVSDTTYSLIPNGFEGPNGTREVHTEVRSLNLTSGGSDVRAGIMADVGRPISPGEVESKSSSGLPANDFPAKSFFDIFVNVDIPLSIGSLSNIDLLNKSTDPLVVTADPITAFPPKVVYVHGQTNAVPVEFRDTNPGLWQSGDVFGWLVVAGHGINFMNNAADIAQFNQVFNSLTPLAVLAPEPSSLVLTACGGLALVGLAATRRLRRRIAE
jgi:hypothetical protein